jgi:polyvinyl alcohol dehydrogenase (cytochrome)
MKNMMRLTFVLAGSFLLCCVDGAFAQSPGDWPMFGQNTANTASNSQSGAISANNVSSLQPKWTFTTGGDISARAAVVNDVAYFPDWAGNLYAVRASNGKLIWSKQLSDDYGLAARTVSRTSPAVVNGFVYIGTQYPLPPPIVPQPPTGWLLKINASTGDLVWAIQPDTSNPFPVITASPVVASGIVYVGMTSNEEFAAGNPSYNCCSVSGSVVAISAATGAKIWETFTVPTGYSGGAVWGSNPVVDEARGTVYVGTGNNYSHPTATDPSDNHADSILAIDMNTGAIKWATRLMSWSLPYVPGSDDWNTACFTPPFTNCPTSPTGPDFDFGSAPNEITYQSATGPKTIIGAGQKSGIYYALDPDTGGVLWQTQVGPGSSLGGMEWGSATDGTRIYVAIANLYGIPYAAGSAGSWAALDPATGAILWQKADPNGAMDLGPVAVANGVVYASSMALPLPPGTPGNPATAPTMFALDATNGNTLWSFAPGSSVNAGATIVNSTVYWGSGYSHLSTLLGTGNNKFYAFKKSGS